MTSPLLRLLSDHIAGKFLQLKKHTGLEALPSKKKVSVHGTGVPKILRPLLYWDGVVKPEKMGKN